MIVFGVYVLSSATSMLTRLILTPACFSYTIHVTYNTSHSQIETSSKKTPTGCSFPENQQPIKQRMFMYTAE